MNNSPTPHPPRNVSLATPNSVPGVSGVQPYNTPGSRTPEEVVNQLLERVKSPLGETDLRKTVEVLEKVSGRPLLPLCQCQTSILQLLQPQFRMSLRARRRVFRGLVKVCGEYGILPSSCIIPESKIKKPVDSEIASGGFSQVLRGTYEGDKPVAIKVIRLHDPHTLDIQGPKKIKEVKKVRHFDLPSSSCSNLIVLRTSTGRS